MRRWSYAASRRSASTTTSGRQFVFWANARTTLMLRSPTSRFIAAGGKSGRFETSSRTRQFATSASFSITSGDRSRRSTSNRQMVSSPFPTSRSAASSGRSGRPAIAVTPQIGQHWTLLTNVGHLDHAGLVACARPVAAATAPPHGTALPVTQGALVPQSGQVASRDQGHPLSSRRPSRHEARYQTGCLVSEPSAVVGTARLVPRWSASWATPSPRASAPVVPRTCAQYLAPGRARGLRMV